MRQQQRTLALCADDFGQSPGISRGIDKLAHAQRLNAVSVLATHPHWPVAAALTRAWPAEVDVGLHFNLSEGSPSSPELRALWPRFPALPRLIAQAHLRQLPLPALAAEWQAQLRAFMSAAKRTPDHIDGHQHVHHLPGVREIVLDAAARLEPVPAVRNTGRVLGPGFAVKRRLIAQTGGVALQRELMRRRWPHNPALLGVYDFVQADYRSLMQGWLRALPPEGGLLFCHPGETDVAGEPDAIAAARGREAAYLGSAQFAQDLADADVTLGRIWGA